QCAAAPPGVGPRGGGGARAGASRIRDGVAPSLAGRRRGLARRGARGAWPGPRGGSPGAGGPRGGGLGAGAARRAPDGLGREVEALARLDRAEWTWERARRAATAAEWRERRGAEMPELVETDVALRLESPAGSDPAASRRAGFERRPRHKRRAPLE